MAVQSVDAFELFSLSGTDFLSNYNDFSVLEAHLLSLTSVKERSQHCLDVSRYRNWSFVAL